MGGSGRTSYILGENGMLERIIRKRKRKNNDQLKTLMREFDKNPNWSKETLLDVSKKTGLSEAQVYKWGWDQKRKKYGPELAALMMPPFEEFEGCDMDGLVGDELAAYHMKMIREAEDEGESFDDDLEPEHQDSRFAPSPFPNEALLEKLSNKLAQEEKEQRENLKVSISGGRVFKSDQPEVSPSTKKSVSKKEPSSSNESA